ncbi:uncharacterized protein LOC134187675 [Corticium candelabrum]|uniref:uncharacterized protein LOC134187675 n=1 Tax=Corticium candelabrum TaxID=121492 RepID=UPI002E256DF0|nr:uncharacterized protein LOC134187675 [Corticium candelabrum]
MASEEFAEELEVAETETESTERKASISYTVKRKLSAIEKYDEYGGNLSRAARDSGVPRSNLQRWVKKRTNSRRYTRSVNFLSERGADIRKDGIAVHGEFIKAQAKKLFKEVYPDEDVENFKASNGWLQKFTVRHDSTFRCVTSQR